MKTLNERERHILIERRLKDNPTTLEELSQQYSISRERVRQIEVRAFEKLQKSMKQQVLGAAAGDPTRRLASHRNDGPTSNHGGDRLGPISSSDNSAFNSSRS